MSVKSSEQELKEIDDDLDWWSRAIKEELVYSMRHELNVNDCLPGDFAERVIASAAGVKRCSKKLTVCVADTGPYSNPFTYFDVETDHPTYQPGFFGLRTRAEAYEKYNLIP